MKVFDIVNLSVIFVDIVLCLYADCPKNVYCRRNRKIPTPPPSVVKGKLITTYRVH